MKTKVFMCRNSNELEERLDNFFKSIGETTKLMIFHKIVKASKGGITFLTYIHYDLK